MGINWLVLPRGRRAIIWIFAVVVIRHLLILIDSGGSLLLLFPRLPLCIGLFLSRSSNEQFHLALRTRSPGFGQDCAVNDAYANGTRDRHGGCGLFRVNTLLHLALQKGLGGWVGHVSQTGQFDIKVSEAVAAPLPPANVYIPSRIGLAFET